MHADSNSQFGHSRRRTPESCALDNLQQCFLFTLGVENFPPAGSGKKTYLVLRLRQRRAKGGVEATERKETQGKDEKHSRKRSRREILSHAAR